MQRFWFGVCSTVQATTHHQPPQAATRAEAATGRQQFPVEAARRRWPSTKSGPWAPVAAHFAHCRTGESEFASRPPTNLGDASQLPHTDSQRDNPPKACKVGAGRRDPGRPASCLWVSLAEVRRTAAINSRGAAGRSILIKVIRRPPSSRGLAASLQTDTLALSGVVIILNSSLFYN